MLHHGAISGSHSGQFCSGGASWVRCYDSTFRIAPSLMLQSLRITAKDLLVGFALTSLVACSGIGGPKYSIDELRAIYGPRQESLIVVASTSGNLEHVKALFHYDPNEKELGSAFLSASENGYPDIVKFLLHRGIDPNSWHRKSEYGLSRYALHIAAEEEHIEVIKELIAAGADVNIATSNGNTPLHTASSRGYTEIVKELIAAGAVSNSNSDERRARSPR